MIYQFYDTNKYVQNLNSWFHVCEPNVYVNNQHLGTLSDVVEQRSDCSARYFAVAVYQRGQGWWR